MHTFILFVFGAFLVLPQMRQVLFCTSAAGLLNTQAQLNMLEFSLNYLPMLAALVACQQYVTRLWKLVVLRTTAYTTSFHSFVTCC